MPDLRTWKRFGIIDPKGNLYHGLWDMKEKTPELKGWEIIEIELKELI